MNKTLTKILAIIGAITAAAAVIILFRDKLAKLFENCKCKCCKSGEDDFEELEGSVEECADKAEETAEEIVDAVKEAAEDAAEKAAAVAEEFKDYADVPDEEKPEE